MQSQTYTGRRTAYLYCLLVVAVHECFRVVCAWLAIGFAFGAFVGLAVLSALIAILQQTLHKIIAKADYIIISMAEEEDYDDDTVLISAKRQDISVCALQFLLMLVCYSRLTPLFKLMGLRPHGYKAMAMWGMSFP